MKDFMNGDFYDTADLERMSKKELIKIAECLQSLFAESNRVIENIKSTALSFDMNSNASEFRNIRSIYYE
jgi:hypothetical protein